MAVAQLSMDQNGASIEEAFTAEGAAFTSWVQQCVNGFFLNYYKKKQWLTTRSLPTKKQVKELTSIKK